MACVKEKLLRQQEEEQELWLSYLEFAAENRELFEQLPKNIRDLVEVCYEESKV